MMHLEIEDANARSAVASYSIQMEVFILNLLGDNADTALAKIDNARQSALQHVKSLGSEFTPMEDDVKASRIAIALLESTFDRLREVYNSPEEYGCSDGEAD